MDNKTEKVKLYKSRVETQLEEGMSKPELAKFYGLNNNQMKIALKRMNLSKKRAKKVDFEIVMDEPIKIKEEEKKKIEKRVTKTEPKEEIPPLDKPVPVPSSDEF